MNINPFCKLASPTQPHTGPRGPGPESSRGSQPAVSPHALPAAAEGAPWLVILFSVHPDLPGVVESIVILGLHIHKEQSFLFLFFAKANFSPAVPQNYPHPGSCLWLPNAFPVSHYK